MTSVNIQIILKMKSAFKIAVLRNIRKLLWVEHKAQDIVTVVYRFFIWKQFGYLETWQGHYVNRLKEIGFGYSGRIKVAEVRV